MVRLAVIDNGVDSRFFSSSPVKSSIEITKDLKVNEYECGGEKYISHGTLCAAVIQKIVPQVQLDSIKIVNEIKNRSSVKQLCSALKWCLQNKIQLISISMGVTDLRDVEELKRCVNECITNGIIIVASHSNYGYKTYPACMDNVIGVRSTAEMDIKNPYFYKFSCMNPNNHDYIAGSSFRIDNAINQNILLPAVNSFATPVITAYVYEFIDNSRGNFNFKKIISYLNSKSIKGVLLPEFVHCDIDYVEKTTPNVLFCDEYKNSTLPYDTYSYIKSRHYNIVGFTDSKKLSNKYGLFELSTLQSLENSNQMNRLTLGSITNIYDSNIIILWLTKKHNIKVVPFLNPDIIIKYNKYHKELVDIIDSDKKHSKLHADCKEIYKYIVNDFNG